MKFFSFLKQFKNRRLVVPALAVLFAVIFGGGIYGLARTGKLNLKFLADPNIGNVYIQLDPTNLGGGGVSLRTTGGTSVPVQGGYQGSAYVINNLPFGTYQYQFGMPGSNGQPCMGTVQLLTHQSYTTYTVYPRFTCGGETATGTYSIEGIIYDSETHQDIPSARVTYGGDSSKYATTDTNGHYKLSGMPILNDIEAMANHSFTINAIGYQAKTLKLRDGFRKNPGDAYGKTSWAFADCNTSLSPTQERYKISGKITKEGLVNGVVTQVLANGVSIKVLDKTMIDETRIITQTTTEAGATYTSGRNYLTPEFSRSDLNHLRIQFSLPGYSTIEKDLSDVNNYLTTSIANGITTIVLKDQSFTALPADLYFVIKGNCPANTPPERCPNRNNLGMIDNITVAAEAMGGIEHSSNSFTPSTLSGVIRNVAPGQRNLYVNSATNNPQYNPAYTSKVEQFDITTLGTLAVAGLGTVKVKTVTLDPDPAYRPQTDQFDFLGKIQNKDGGAVATQIKVFCSGYSGCSSYPSVNQITSGTAFTADGGVSRNYKFTNLKNIVGTGIGDLKVQITAPSGTYVDINGNSRKDPEENDGIATIRQSDIVVRNDKSFCNKNFTIRPTAESDMMIYGNVTDDSSKPMSASVKLVEVLGNGNLAGTAVMTVSTGSTANRPSNYYELSGLKSKVDTAKEYALIAEPQKTEYSSQIVYVRFNNTPVMNINFQLALNNGYYTFTGYVQNIDASGRIQNIIGADVFAELNGHAIYLAYTKPDNSKYQITLRSSEIFEGIDVPDGTKKTIVLRGFNKKSSIADKQKTYTFELTKGKGFKVNRDFVFSSGDPSNPPATTKNVTVNITEQLKKFAPIFKNDDPKLIGSGQPKPLNGVRLRLKSLRGGSAQDGSSFETFSEEKETINGKVIFYGFPKQEAKIEIISGVDETLILQGGEASLVVPALSPSETLNYYKVPWDTGALQEAVDEIKMQQCGNGPKDNTQVWYPASDDGDGHFEVCEAGCCLTSIAMAIKFYYPDKMFVLQNGGSGQPMSPFYLGDLSMRYQLNGGFGGWEGLVSKTNALNATSINLRTTNLDGAKTYLRAGIPVVLWSKSRPMKDHGGEHCVLLTSYDEDSGLFGIIDPNPHSIPSAVQYRPASDLGSMDRIQAVISDESAAYFNAVGGRRSQKSGSAFAADGPAQKARIDSDYQVSATIGSNTAAKIQDVYLKYDRDNSTTDYSYKMNKNGDNYSFAIPKYMINSGFKYSFVAINAFGAEIHSQEYPVELEIIRNNPTIALDRAFSSFRFNAYNVRNTSVSNTVDKLQTLYQTFRTAFSTFLSRMGINQSQTVTISGTVVNASGNRVPNVIVRIWEDAGFSLNGYYTVPNVLKGTVPIEVVSMYSNQNLTVITPMRNITRSLTGLKILVDDPNDIGTVKGSVKWGAAQIPVATGKLQFIRNDKVDKEINLAESNGSLNVEKVQVGEYRLKYLASDNTEKTLALAGGATTFSVKKGEATNITVLVRDRVSVSGKVTDHWPRSSVGAVVVLQDPAFTTGERTTLCTSTPIAMDGSYSFSNVLPGSYYVAIKKNYRYMQMTTNKPSPMVIAPAIDITDLNIQTYN